MIGEWAIFNSNRTPQCLFFFFFVKVPLNVNALNSSDRDLPHEGIIFRDIKSFLRPNFVSVEVLFAPRSSNKVAPVPRKKKNSNATPTGRCYGKIPTG
jgi:hypothetical protein